MFKVRSSPAYNRRESVNRRLAQARAKPGPDSFAG
jgi:hypothetical protein